MNRSFSRRALFAGTAGMGLLTVCCDASVGSPRSPNNANATEASVEADARGRPGAVDEPRLPSKILAGYWPTWVPGAVRVRDLPPEYNVVHLFGAAPNGTSGELAWQPPGDGRGARTHLRVDVNHARSGQGRSVVLAIGGAGRGLSFESRATSSRFVDDVCRIIDTEIGRVDGVDLNTFEAEHAPNLPEYSWISDRLKTIYGGAFAVCAPPAPWRDTDKAFCKELAGAGLLDLCGPQYYDNPALANVQYIVDSVGEWAGLVGAQRLYVGFGIGSGSPSYLTVQQCAEAWTQVRQSVVGVRGAYCWSIPSDEATGWRFASDLGPLVLT